MSRCAASACCTPHARAGAGGQPCLCLVRLPIRSARVCQARQHVRTRAGAPLMQPPTHSSPPRDAGERELAPTCCSCLARLALCTEWRGDAGAWASLSGGQAQEAIATCPHLLCAVSPAMPRASSTDGEAVLRPSSFVLDHTHPLSHPCLTCVLLNPEKPHGFCHALPPVVFLTVSTTWEACSSAAWEARSRAASEARIAGCGPRLLMRGGPVLLLGLSCGCGLVMLGDNRCLHVRGASE